MTEQDVNTAPTKAPCNADGSFTIKLKNSQATYEIPADRSVLEVLEENDIELPFACAEGICGTCITGVIAGTPDHNDMFMTVEEQAENDQFTPCCSRSKTAMLILDL